MLPTLTRRYSGMPSFHSGKRIDMVHAIERRDHLHYYCGPDSNFCWDVVQFLFLLRLVPNQRDANRHKFSSRLFGVFHLITGGVQYIVSYMNSPKFIFGFSFRAIWSCVAASLLGYTAYFASVFFITFVTFERYMAICHPLKHRMIKGKKRAVRMTTITLIISLCMGAFGSFNSKASTWCVEWQDPTTGVMHLDKIPVCAEYPIFSDDE